MQQFEAKHSKNIAWARYDEATSILEVDFKNAKGERTTTYAYDAVSKQEWEEFRAAESKGKHFAFKIRPNYTGRKIRG